MGKAWMTISKEMIIDLLQLPEDTVIHVPSQNIVLLIEHPEIIEHSEIIEPFEITDCFIKVKPAYVRKSDDVGNTIGVEFVEFVEWKQYD